ncbi:AAA family ATPase [Pedobacter sp. GR22-10]|uniref:AAA family ATPase n=1 Tax=Pedobacter sp. GR22-10 TaxID=2994472 RepID=UPI0022468F41|nr:AAA family ATPase [Pedobacter sp. GR22-10]MCX2431115.1 AAA family ATPase [Pedobacter sp. GR22-10]
MRKIKKVKIDGFWENRSVVLDFDSEINFLIGVNGSGKTTIINLIAASLKADFSTLDKAQFSKIRVDFFSFNDKRSSEAYIEVEKKERNDSMYPNINFKIKLPDHAKAKIFNLNELEEEVLYRYPTEYLRHKFYNMHSNSVGRDINLALGELVNVTWLSIHRANKFNKNSDDSSFESLIDQKIKELSTDLIKYFGVLDKQYSVETEKFQKNIFLSLIEDEKEDKLLKTDDLDPEKEQESLRQIFLLFKLQESEFSDKLENHFTGFNDAKNEFNLKKSISVKKLAYILGTRRIHSIVQEWGSLNGKKNLINKPKITFLTEVNSLFQNKQVFINEKNELLIKTKSGKIFSLLQLSSGEKQLLIILGESLLQENQNHIYIADEPELSLHVEWQERLVSSLKNINQNSQIIFATHSPDIVGKFYDYILNVEEAIR